MAFSLTDDGTMDTVVRCDECGEEVRFNRDGADDADLKPCCALCIPEGCPNCYGAYVDECCNYAAEDHQCSASDEPDEDSINIQKTIGAFTSDGKRPR